MYFLFSLFEFSYYVYVVSGFCVVVVVVSYRESCKHLIWRSKQKVVVVVYS